MEELHNRCPVDLRPLPSVRVSTEQDILEAAALARVAQREWEALGFEKRARLMKQAARMMLARRQEVLELLHEEAGKTPGETLLSEAVGPLQYIKDWVSVARPWLKPRRLPVSRLAFPRKSGTIEMLPRGVVGVIAPWNYPLANFFKPVFAALLCGNSVIIKPSEYSPRTAEWFVKIMGESLPAGVLSLVQGGKDVGQSLIRSGVDALTFTGSFESGREVASLAAERMIPCSVELGGKDAAIVFADCDLDRTVAGIMHWALHNAGQACGDIERVYVEASIADRFIEKLANAVSRLRVQSGDTQNSDMGPCGNNAQLSVVEEHVADAMNQGAKLVCGGKRTGKGLWFEPTILDGCNHSMKVMREPTFGPVIPIVRVKDAQEAILLANDCEYGLNASIWSKDIRRATSLAKQLLVGTAFVNNHAFTGAIPAAPWTGVKKTGYGVANSVFALQHYTRPRTMVIDRNKSADGWWFPMDAVAEELGHCLADAQIGKVLSALKVPFLMATRQRTVMSFIRGAEGGHGAKASLFLQDRRPVRGAVYQGLAWFRLQLMKLVRRALPRLSRWELAWGKAAMETIYSSDESGGASRLTTMIPLSKENADSFLEDIYQHLPFPANLSMRATLWMVGLAPMVKQRKLKTLDRLPPEERLEILQSFSRSESYLLRQSALLLKMNGALSHASTTRMHAVIEGGDAPQAPEANG